MASPVDIIIQIKLFIIVELEITNCSNIIDDFNADLINGGLIPIEHDRLVMIQAWRRS